MELILNGSDLRTLAEMGVLNEVIMKCTVGGPEEVKAEPVKEEKPKKKRTTKKAVEPTVEEASQEVAEVTAPSPVGLEAAVEEAAPIVSEPIPSKTAEPLPGDHLSIEQLAQKAIKLMDNGKGGDLQALLQKFGVSSLPELQPEQYGGFYASLLEMEG